LVQVAHVVFPERHGIWLVLKKILKAGTTLTLLVGCYFGYVRLFDIVVEQLRATRRPENIMFQVRDSNSKLQSIAYARAAFGPGHWSAAENLAYRYYNADRGFWIYAQEWERIIEENGIRYDGKRMRLRPFALIMKSPDGKNTKTITSDRAVFDLNEPLSFNVNADGEPLKIKHAHLEPNVQIRDDKSTPADRTDDMEIGPLTTLDLDESTQQITTDSHVVIRDPEIVTSGDGMLIQLRRAEIDPVNGSSSGFGGAERMDLTKNVHIIMRDVGKSGMLPGPATKALAADSTRLEANQPGEKPEPQGAAEPTPLDLRCDSKMQVFFPRPQLPVVVGPPSPAAPTLVQFERNVVVLRGPLDGQPDQMTCDTLVLHLVPGEKSPGSASEPTAVTKTAEAAGEKEGLFGNLMLQRAHATGLAVWLYLPAQGVKLRCNQLIHTRQLPFKPDTTYFRGDLTRPLELEKIDVVKEEGPDQGRISSVTHIRTADATLYDHGNGMNAANVVANGPGQLETQPDLDQPIERIAIWQDKFYLHNEVGPDGQLTQKIVVLTGTRPCFIDKVQGTRLDSGQWIRVWLKPKPRATPSPNDHPSTSSSLAGLRGDPAPGVDRAAVARPVVVAGTRHSPESENGDIASRGADSGLGGGNFQIERLWALDDVHLLAPARTMTARQWLDAEFISTALAATESSPRAQGTSSASAPVTNSGQVQQSTGQAASGQDEVAAQGERTKSPSEPPMVGSADRIWAKLEVKPKSSDAPSGSRRKKDVEARLEDETGVATPGSSRTPGLRENSTELRKVWLWGSVWLHQDPEEGKAQGQEASGETVYLDNRGKGKIFTEIYQREPNEKTYIPGPLPPARVENADMKFTAAGKLTMDQATDEAEAEGPGTLTQLGAKPAEGEGKDASRSARPTVAEASKSGLEADNGHDGATTQAETTTRISSSGLLGSSPSAKSKTRAGRPVDRSKPTTIAFSERMKFIGRTTDPEGNPAARADFFGVVTAQMEDALLHAEEKIIAFTDRVVPLAQLGAMSRSRSKVKPSSPDEGPPAEGSDTDDQPQLTLLYCYRKAVGINRRVDALTPTLLEQRRVEADDMLDYDRRTGHFNIAGKGMVYLFDRSDNSSRAPGMGSDSEGDADRASGSSPRIVTPTSARAPYRANSSSGTGAGGKGRSSSPEGRQGSNQPKTGDFPPLVLTQIRFNKGMRGRVAAGQVDEKVATNWYEFFGDIQFARAKVADAQSVLDFDKLPRDGLYLTSQTLRVRTEPPPVGSPPSTPARDYVKAWEKAYVWSNDKSLQSDVITYDSEKDLVYSFGENGRGVIYAQQHATGQPASVGTAKAMRLNPKTGAMHFIDNNTVQLIDKNSGTRPDVAKPVDPDARKPKPPRRPFRLPSGNVERRGFSGQ
jgi:hypothetical protein